MTFRHLVGGRFVDTDVLQRRLLRAFDSTDFWMGDDEDRCGKARSWFAGAYLLRVLGGGSTFAARALAEIDGKCWPVVEELWDPERRPDEARHAFREGVNAEKLYAMTGALLLSGAIPPAEPWSPGVELLGWGHHLPPPEAAALQAVGAAYARTG